MRRRLQRGFTLIELLVVVGILVVLVALFMPATRGAREAARRASCAVKIKSLAQALHMTGDNPVFPPSAFDSNFDSDDQSLFNSRRINLCKPGDTTAATKAPYSFIVKLLPYMEKGHVFDAIAKRHDDPFTAGGVENGYVQAAQIIPSLICPSFRGSGSEPRSNAAEYTPPGGTQKPALTNYKALGATTMACLQDSTKVTDHNLNGGTLHPYAAYKLHDLKELTQTAVLVETKEENYAAWYDGTTASIPGFHAGTGNPADGYATTPITGAKPALNYPPAGTSGTVAQANFLATAFGGAHPMRWGPSSEHPGLVMHAMAGTETKAIQNDIDPVIYAALISRRKSDNDAIGDYIK